MEFKSFAEYLKEREVTAENANKEAMGFDTQMQTFRNRFPDTKQGEQIVQAAGFDSIPAFLQAAKGNPSIWSKLRIPGQKNYV